MPESTETAPPAAGTPPTGATSHSYNGSEVLDPNAGPTIRGRSSGPAKPDAFPGDRCAAWCRQTAFAGSS